ncbi:peptidyl-prolyl cis-trans isomerase [Luteirhabdus pelagi]|uniref:peptidyl-prolyl cis-trans isomerase n=1 Tax=Luteirhabdus pelagi TaxID=2792783 RepID=UPI00193A5DDC|nr:peptidyl-prolyl cis-trans isomerase [Luteirhabdus pelagi]
MNKFLVLIWVAVTVASCEYFTQEPEGEPVARVNETFLYREDLSGLVPAGTSETDSTIIVNNYINRWATQRLLMDKALINLPDEQLENYHRLLKDYKTELYTEGYKNAIVAQELDSSVSENELQSFYEENKQNFRLNDELLKVRYLQVPPSFSNLGKTVEKFRRFNESDQEDLNAISIQFTRYNFNDSTWVRKNALEELLPVLKDENAKMLNISNFQQLQDSLGVYLIYVKDRLNTNDIAPLSYVKPTIEQVLLNKRKLELIKKLEKDLTRDARNDKSFEIYK